MKIIDVLIRKANGTLEDGFRFRFNELIYISNDDEIPNYVKIEEDEAEIVYKTGKYTRLIFDKIMREVWKTGITRADDAMNLDDLNFIQYKIKELGWKKLKI